MKKAENQIMVIFGASGDLTARKLMPALYELHVNKLLPATVRIIGAARTPYSDDEFRALTERNLRSAWDGRGIDGAELASFLRQLSYCSFDPTQSPEYARLKSKIAEVRDGCGLCDNVLYYLATPPIMYEIIPAFLRDNGMNLASSDSGWRRIIVEKPFGTGLDSARHLDRLLSGIFKEDQIYRIDHYLGKETVQNILVLRFANGIFEPLWNRNYIDSVEISASETLGVERRGRYYDNAGALRDMVQNHLMQLMAFTAMEAPSSFSPEPLRDEIVKVFRSLHRYSEEEMDGMIVRGQYEGYRQEPDVSPSSNTETFVALKMFIENWRWGGVPFFFYTGKKMPERASEIVVNFKNTPQQMFVGQCSGSSCNKLVIRIQPEEKITMKFGLKVPGAGFKVRQVGMDFRYDSLSSVRLPDAYERLLLDAMLGDSTLYARNDALEESWSVIDPILSHWKAEGEKNLFSYGQGEEGPLETMRLKMPHLCYSCAEDSIADWFDDGEA